MTVSRPIIFSTPMVKALLDGRKSMTRRIIKPQPTIERDLASEHLESFELEDRLGPEIKNGHVVLAKPVRFSVGDLLWCRETWKPHSIYAAMKPREIPKTKVFYRADDAYAPSNTKWVPPIHMPRWASRITLKVTAVKVERLQEIVKFKADPDWPGMNSWNTDDLCAEGLPEELGYSSNPHDYVNWFIGVWTSLHGPASWKANPFVVAISFETLKKNIAAVLAESAQTEAA